MKEKQWSSYIAVALIVALVAIVRRSAFFITEYWWFSAAGFGSVFTRIWTAKALIGLVAGLLFFLIIYINVAIVHRTSPLSLQTLTRNVVYLRALPLVDRYLYLISTVIALFLSFGAGLAAAQNWDTVLRAVHAVPFGIRDPVFHKDVGFYVLKLPFYEWAWQHLFTAIVVALVLSLLLYVASTSIQWLASGPYVAPQVRAHLSVLLAVVFFWKAVGYRLRMFDLLDSGRGFAYGAFYTDLHATLPALKLLLLLALLAGVLMLVNARLNALKLLAGTVVAMVIVSVAAGNAFPAFVQQFRVAPNELDLERQYIRRNIEFTRHAYGLDKTVVAPFTVAPDITRETISHNQPTIDSVRLWDHRPLLKTYRQLQVIRSYYSFPDVDSDRYEIAGKYRQVVIAAREFDAALLPDAAQTWVNLRLKWTHGYGACMSPVNEIAGEGQPEFFIKDIPPHSIVGPQITRPEIYYGSQEDTSWVLVDSLEKEFDYPKGDDNVMTTYGGKGGVPVGSWLRRIAFAFRLADVKLLLSNAITHNTRLMLRRNVVERVHAIAPFLLLDEDPYLVVADGKLVWILDAYTQGTRYPYSQPVNGGINYIRNSIKITVSAYDGRVTFYVVDDTDPVARTYERIFPHMFQPGSRISDTLRRHLRYPIDLFRLQAKMYARYHMRNPDTFYNQEDLWGLATEVESQSSNEVDMEPYYIMMKLPGESREEFLLMTPFTPIGKTNMIAWMAARCDPAHYGQIQVYQFSKDRVIWGPMQIEARMNQNTRISQLLSLWNQQGSKVIRGNLVVIPIDGALLYVEPLYLQAEKSELPELKRVVVSDGTRVVMGDNLPDALDLLLGPANGAFGAPGTAIPPGAVKAADAAWRSYQRVTELLREGNWSEFAGEQQNLARQLQLLRKDLNPGEPITGTPGS